MHTNTPVQQLRNESGLPLGGIGAGKIEFCWDGRITNITTNNNWDCPIYNHSASFPLLPRIREGAPGSYEENSQRRQSITDYEGLPGGWLAFYDSMDGARVLKVKGRSTFACLLQEEIDFNGRFPTARVRYPGIKACAVELTAFSSFMAPDFSPEYRDSSLPLAFFHLRVTNTQSTALDAGLAFSWQNLNGVGGYAGVPLNQPDPTSPVFRAGPSAPGLWFGHDPATTADLRTIGDYSLRAWSDKPDAILSYCAGWDTTGRGEDVWQSFSQTGQFDNANLPFTGGALGVKVHLLPGEQAEVVFCLAWNMPHLLAAETEWQYLVRPSGCAPAPSSPNRKNYGHAYNRWFANSWEIAEYGILHWQDTLHRIRAWQAGLLDSSLPERLVDGLCNDLFPLYACSWYTRDLLFAMNEAPTDMSGCMGTIDQRGVGHAAAALMFPNLNRAELSLFARDQIGDETDPRHWGLHHNLKTGRFNLRLNREGAILHDVGWDHLEGGRLGDSVWSSAHWPEHTSLFTLQAYQHAVWNGDQAWLDENYPRIKKALQFQSRLDQDDDGIGDLWGPGSNTYDTELYPYYGATPYIATLYLAALQVGQKLALEQDDQEFVQWASAKIIQVANTLAADLWNPRLGYFHTWYDRNHRVWDGTAEEHPIAGTQCHISQLAGEFWARLLNLDPLIEPCKRDQILQSIFDRNVSQVPGSPADEFRTDGTYSQSMCAFVMGYYGGLATASGFPDYGWKAVQNVYRVRYDLDGSLWDAHLQWSGPGNEKTQWGRWYFSIPASWYYLWSITGAQLNRLEGELTLNPSLPGEWGKDGKNLPVLLPGLHAQLDFHPEADQHTYLLKIESLAGDFLNLKRIGFRLPEQWQGKAVRLDVRGLSGCTGQDRKNGAIYCTGSLVLAPKDQIEFSISVENR